LGAAIKKINVNLKLEKLFLDKLDKDLLIKKLSDLKLINKRKPIN